MFSDRCHHGLSLLLVRLHVRPLRLQLLSVSFRVGIVRRHVLLEHHPPAGVASHLVHLHPRVRLEIVDVGADGPRLHRARLPIRTGWGGGPQGKGTALEKESSGSTIERQCPEEEREVRHCLK